MKRRKTYNKYAKINEEKKSKETSDKSKEMLSKIFAFPMFLDGMAKEINDIYLEGIKAPSVEDAQDIMPSEIAHTKEEKHDTSCFSCNNCSIKDICTKKTTDAECLNHIVGI